MDSEASKRAEADEKDRNLLLGPSLFGERGESEFNEYLGRDLRHVLSAIVRELHFQAFTVKGSSDEKVVFEAAGIKFLVKPSEIPSGGFLWKEASFLMERFMEAAFAIFNHEADCMLPGHPYTG